MGPLLNWGIDPAYLFLEPLDEEAEEYFLFDVLTDEFVVELKRRAGITGGSLGDWFGVDAETSQAIINHYREQYEGKKRWVISQAVENRKDVSPIC